MHRKRARKCRLKRSQMGTQKVDEWEKGEKKEDFAGVEWEGKAGGGAGLLSEIGGGASRRLREKKVTWLGRQPDLSSLSALHTTNETVTVMHREWQFAANVINRMEGELLKRNK